jgi:hypothetical protein
MKKIENIYNNLNTIIDDLLECHSKLKNTDKQKNLIFLQICELEKQLTKIGEWKYINKYNDFIL